MKPRFQADNDLRNSIRTGVLRNEPSIDFQSALAARLDGVPDPEVLRLAMVQGRMHPSQRVAQLALQCVRKMKTARLAALFLYLFQPAKLKLHRAARWLLHIQEGQAEAQGVWLLGRIHATAHQRARLSSNCQLPGLTRPRHIAGRSPRRRHIALQRVVHHHPVRIKPPPQV